jgi:hypothetical protein
MLPTKYGLIWRNISAVTVRLHKKNLSAVREHKSQTEFQNKKKKKRALGFAYSEQVS